MELSGEELVGGDRERDMIMLLTPHISTGPPNGSTVTESVQIVTQANPHTIVTHIPANRSTVIDCISPINISPLSAFDTSRLPLAIFIFTAVILLT